MQKSAPIIAKFTLHQWLVVVLMLTSFITTWLVSDRVFEHLPHLEDEVAYLFQARLFARGDLVLRTPEPALAYWQPFVITDSKTGYKFGKYPLGYPALMSIGIDMGAIWIINAFSAMLSVGLVYKIGRVLFNSEVGLFASALMAFSPMALLLSGTMMSHTPAIFLFLLFWYSFIWIEKRRHPVHWGIMAGLALGLLVINRPLTAVAVSLPFILWAGIKTVRAGVIDTWRMLLWLDNWLDRDRQLRGIPHFRQLWAISHTTKLIIPYACIGILALAFSRATPIFNFTATGNPNENLYLRIWNYDRIGFGEGYGRSGHTITKGVRHARYDLSLTAGDLFGWAIQRPRNPDDPTRFLSNGVRLADLSHPEIQKHLQESSAYFPLFGLSFFILPIGLFIGFRAWWMQIWLLVASFWLIVPLYHNAGWLGNDEATLWAWVLGLLALILIPLVIFILTYHDRPPQRARFISWGWIITAVITPIIGWGLMNWSGRDEFRTYGIVLGFVFALIASYLLVISDIHHRQWTVRFEWSLWTWLLLAICTSLIGWHLAYWVGSQRYSTRYYSEALPAFALIGGLGLYGIIDYARQLVGWIFSSARQTAQFAVTCGGYAFITILLLGSMYLYSIPRIHALYRFNNVSPYMADQIRARATDDRPILVMVNGQRGDISWRAYGSLMALTSPYLDSDIVAAWNYELSNDLIRERILARFADRQVIELNIKGTDAWFMDCDITQNPACNLNPPPR